MNNFDQSSTGVNLELSAFYDNDLSQILFNDNFKILQYSDIRQGSILVYTFENVIDVSYFSISDPSQYDLRSATKEEMIKHDSIHLEDLNDNAKHYFGKSYKRLNKDELLECILDYCLYDEDEQSQYLKDTFTAKYTTIASHGYCQGDYSTIYIPDEVIAEYPNCTKDTIGDYLQSHIDHLLWDAPIHARLTVDDEEYYIDEYLESMWDWDKDKVLESTGKIFDGLSKEKINLIYLFLQDNLPENLDYV